MLDTKFNQHSKYTSQDKLNVIKLTITRLFMMIGIWTIFFMLYNLKESQPLSFQPILLCVLGIYALGEIVLMFYDLRCITKR